MTDATPTPGIPNSGIRWMPMSEAPPEIRKMFDEIGGDLKAQFEALDGHGGEFHQKIPPLFTIEIRPCGCRQVWGPPDTDPDMAAVATHLEGLLRHLYDTGQAPRTDKLVDPHAYRIAVLAGGGHASGGDVTVCGDGTLNPAQAATFLAAITANMLAEQNGVTFSLDGVDLGDEADGAPDRLTEEDLNGGPGREPV